MEKYFSFDAETDGLYGPSFAIGAVVFEDGKFTKEFKGVLKDADKFVTSDWVRENCLPIADGYTQYETRADLLNAFWDFYMENKKDAKIFADVGVPVESQVFRECVQLDLANRQWDGPYPLHEVASYLDARGIDPDIDRIKFSGFDGRKHDPCDDAKASVICVLKSDELYKELERKGEVYDKHTTRKKGEKDFRR
jgi:hypothetical protein